MCLGTTTTSPVQTVNWGRGPWDERPAIQVDDNMSPSKDSGKNVSSTNKKGALKATKSQSSKTTGGAY